MNTPEVLIVGAGLAGLSAAFELVKAGCKVEVLESRAVLGGRTSSWVQDGMMVESGLHKFLGIYRALPRLLNEVGVDCNDILEWVDELAILHPGRPEARFVPSPYHHPLGMLASLVGNNDLIPPLEKPKLAAFAAAGTARCVSDPEALDQLSLADYAASFGISPAVIADVVSTGSQAVLFLPAEQFSAYAAFAPTVEGLKNLMTFRLGAFRGGMTEVMINPIVRGIEARGGRVTKSAAVAGLIIEQGAATGVRLQGGREIRASQTIVATPLHIAQRLIGAAFPDHPSFQPTLRLPSLSAATIQFELTEPLLPSDRTNFSSTGMCCFAEQSRTTFRELPGRLSVILYPPEEYLSLPAEEVAQRVYTFADQLGLPLRRVTTRYRIVNHAHDFYAMRPGTEALRPAQQTDVPGLTLAGDYTKQPWSASMEGAVVSGRLAAAAILDGE
jgi:15-cis-phytoene desaturase